MKVLKALIKLLFFVGFCFFIFFLYKERDQVVLFFRDNIFQETKNVKINKEDINEETYKKYNYLYLQDTDDFIAKDKKHLMNILYTIVNSGINDFIFYCDSKYSECTNDISELLNDDDNLYYINNFVHPYNTYKYLSVNYSSYGKVNVTIDKNYTQEEIDYINEIVDNFINNNIDINMSEENKIKIIHDYIINNSKYIKDTKVDKDNYSNAYDILYSGYGTCNAYSDLMAIFLNKLNINNYQISSENHIWNLVFVNNSWYHLDVTWDDPVTNTNEDLLGYDYFLITDKTLKSYNDQEHNYNEEVFLEI